MTAVHSKVQGQHKVVAVAAVMTVDCTEHSTKEGLKVEAWCMAEKMLQSSKECCMTGMIHDADLAVAVGAGRRGSSFYCS